MTPAELDELVRGRAPIGAAPAAPLAPPTAREQFDALERHRSAQRWQWALGAVVALGSIYWLSTRVSRLEGAIAEIMREDKADA